MPSGIWIFVPQEPETGCLGMLGAGAMVAFFGFVCCGGITNAIPQIIAHSQSVASAPSVPDAAATAASGSSLPDPPRDERSARQASRADRASKPTPPTTTDPPSVSALYQHDEAVPGEPAPDAGGIDGSASAIRGERHVAVVWARDLDLPLWVKCGSGTPFVGSAPLAIAATDECLVRVGDDDATLGSFSVGSRGIVTCDLQDGRAACE